MMYHSVSAVPAGPMRGLAVPPARLAEQLGALAGEGYALLGLTAAISTVENYPSARVVAVTFDDGFLDLLTAGLDVLRDARATATLYMSVGHAGATASWMGAHASTFGPMLDWPQVREVVAAGVEIGNHGMAHHPLDVLPPAVLDREVAQSRERLRQETQTDVPSFAYPHGYHGGRVRQAVARHGHESACEVGRRVANLGEQRLAIPRLHVTAEHSGEDVLRLVRGGGPRLVPGLKRLAQPGWRTTRKLAGAFGKQLT
jgi:peptidoglycan/xylan/chitin deacetylase (PgdA/CDA1 family)